MRSQIGKFDRTAFYNDRAGSAEAMRKAIDEKFRETGFATCENL
jgi:hypothetical protein